MDDRGAFQAPRGDEPSSPTCSQASSSPEPQTEIHDPFGELDPSEQNKVMAAHLQRYEERATDSNKRTLHRVLDMILATEGSDAMQLDILATHMGKESRHNISSSHLFAAMDEAQSEIYDPFHELNPSERSESISRALAQFGKRMEDSNKRVVARLLDTIAKTNGNEELHLDILATHLDKETTETIRIKARTDELENTWVWDPAITRLSDFVLTDSGISTWSEETTHDYIAGFLERLVLAVRATASRELLTDTTIDNLQLPAAFCEFTRHQHFGESQMAQPLDKMRQYCGQTRHHEFAAGWKAGDNYNNCVIYYALTLRYDEPDEPWQ
ncbi:hypothetical protein KCU65_g998, partial [Aureobasidium melanogenum]